jgi:site-specific DNA-methyltransferase (adenine-specific)
MTMINKILHGDCLEIMREIPDKSIDMIFTDPPYGHNNNNNGDLIQAFQRPGGGISGYCKGEGKPILNDGPEANDLFRSFLVEAFRVLVPSGCCCCCCCGGGGPDPQFARWSLWMDDVFRFKQMVVWDKGKIGMGWHYRRSYEVILVGEKQGSGPAKWYDTTNRIENIIRHIGKIIPSKDQHPTEKPVALAAHFIKLHSQPGEVILDPFCGSGSTLVAAHRLHCNYIGIELDPKWVDHARKRLKQETAQIGMFHNENETEKREDISRMDTGKLWGGF